MVAYTHQHHDIDKLKTLIHVSNGFFNIHRPTERTSESDWLEAPNEKVVKMLLDEKTGLPCGNLILLDLETTTSATMVQAIKFYFRHFCFFEKTQPAIDSFVTACRAASKLSLQEKPMAYQIAMQGFVQDLVESGQQVHGYCLYELLRMIHKAVPEMAINDADQAPAITAAIAPVFQQALNIAPNPENIIFCFEVFANVIKDRSFDLPFEQRYPDAMLESDSKIDRVAEAPANKTVTSNNQVGKEAEEETEKAIEQEKKAQSQSESQSERDPDSSVANKLLSKLESSAKKDSEQKPARAISSESQSTDHPIDETKIQSKPGSNEMIENNESHQPKKPKVSLTPEAQAMLGDKKPSNPSSAQPPKQGILMPDEPSDMSENVTVEEIQLNLNSKSRPKEQETNKVTPESSAKQPTVGFQKVTTEAEKTDNKEHKDGFSQLKFYWALVKLKAQQSWAFIWPKLVQFWQYAYPKAKAFAIWFWPRFKHYTKVTGVFLWRGCQKLWRMIFKKNKKS